MKTQLFLFLTGLSFASAADVASSLQLTDGRVFADWKILSETPSSLVLKHKNGIAKVGKNLLPPDVLAAHPIDPEGAKREAENLAAAARAGEERQAALEAKNARLNEAAAHTKAANPTPVPSAPSVNYDVLENAATDRADEYFKTVRTNGSGYSLVFNFKTSELETRPVPGWSDRYEVTGKVRYQYYESTWGGSFSSVNSRFTVLLEYRPGDRRPKVVGFTPSF